MADSTRNPFGGLSPHEIHNRLVELGERWADLEAAASLYEDTSKALLAQMTIKAMDPSTHGKSARTIAEATALAAPEWEAHIRRTVEARRDATKASVRYKSALVWVDLLRSMNANRRTEMQLGGTMA